MLPLRPHRRNRGEFHSDSPGTPGSRGAFPPSRRSVAHWAPTERSARPGIGGWPGYVGLPSGSWANRPSSHRGCTPHPAPGPGDRDLLREAKVAEDVPDPRLGVLLPELLLDDLGHALQGPEVRGIAVGTSPSRRISRSRVCCVSSIFRGPPGCFASLHEWGPWEHRCFSHAHTVL